MFVFPEYSPSRSKDYSGPSIADALAQRVQPTVVAIPSDYITWSIGPTVSTLFPNVAISSIVFSDAKSFSKNNWRHDKWRERLPRDLRRLLRDPAYVAQLIDLALTKSLSREMESTPVHSHAGNAPAFLPNPFFKPLQNVSPDLQAQIWTHIFRNACDSLSTTVHRRSSWMNPIYFDIGVAETLLSVCRDFKVSWDLLYFTSSDNEVQSIMLPLLCKHVVISGNPQQDQKSCDMLEEQPDLANRMQTLVSTGSRWLPQILTHTMHLREMEFKMMVDEARARDAASTIALIAETVGHSLEVLSVGDCFDCSELTTTTCASSVGIWKGFSALRVLDFGLRMIFEQSDEIVEMPRLRTLRLRRTLGLAGASLSYVHSQHTSSYQSAIGCPRSASFITRPSMLT